ncbi:hypothetical protein STEG23_016019, partial [Scotinomys teguina]
AKSLLLLVFKAITTCVALTRFRVQSIHPSVDHAAEPINGKLLDRVTHGHSKCDKTETGHYGIDGEMG